MLELLKLKKLANDTISIKEANKAIINSYLISINEYTTIEIFLNKLKELNQNKGYYKSSEFFIKSLVHVNNDVYTKMIFLKDTKLLSLFEYCNYLYIYVTNKGGGTNILYLDLIKESKTFFKTSNCEIYNNDNYNNISIEESQVDLYNFNLPFHVFKIKFKVKSRFNVQIKNILNIKANILNLKISFPLELTIDDDIFEVLCNSLISLNHSIKYIKLSGRFNLTNNNEKKFKNKKIMKLEKLSIKDKVYSLVYYQDLLNLFKIIEVFFCLKQLKKLKFKNLKAITDFYTLSFFISLSKVFNKHSSLEKLILVNLRFEYYNKEVFLKIGNNKNNKVNIVKTENEIDTIIDSFNNLNFIKIENSKIIALDINSNNQFEYSNSFEFINSLLNFEFIEKYSYQKGTIILSLNSLIECNLCFDFNFHFNDYIILQIQDSLKEKIFNRQKEKLEYKTNIDYLISFICKIDKDCELHANQEKYNQILTYTKYLMNEFTNIKRLKK